MAFRNEELDNQNDSKHDCGVDVESDIVQENRIKNPVCQKQRHVSPAPHVPGLICPTQKSQRPAETVIMTVNAIEMRRNKGVKKK